VIELQEEIDLQEIEHQEVTDQVVIEVLDHQVIEVEKEINLFFYSL
jgi:hypothetical protein